MHPRRHRACSERLRSPRVCLVRSSAPEPKPGPHRPAPTLGGLPDGGRLATAPRDMACGGPPADPRADRACTAWTRTTLLHRVRTTDCRLPEGGCFRDSRRVLAPRRDEGVSTRELSSSKRDPKDPARRQQLDDPFAEGDHVAGRILSEPRITTRPVVTRKPVRPRRTLDRAGRPEPGRASSDASDLPKKEGSAPGVGTLVLWAVGQQLVAPAWVAGSAADAVCRAVQPPVRRSGRCRLDASPSEVRPQVASEVSPPRNRVRRSPRVRAWCRSRALCLSCPRGLGRRSDRAMRGRWRACSRKNLERQRTLRERVPSARRAARRAARPPPGPP